MTTLEYANRYLAAGISVIPVARDGSKAPDWTLLPQSLDEDTGRLRRTWLPYRGRLATAEEASRWWDRPDPPGIAVICGSASGMGIEQIDFDAEADAIFPAWRDLVEESCPGLVGRLCVTRTPRGWHVGYAVDGHVPPNDKLARDPAQPDAKRRTLIETRGEGGYVVAPGSPPECHPDGKTWTHHSGPELWDAPCLSADEREVLVACARWFDRTPPAAPPQPRPTHAGNGNGHAAGLRPGEDYDRRGPDWSEILEPHGWSCVSGSASGERRWRRPGKGLGWSATTGKCHGRDHADLLRVFSSNADPFEEGKSYGKFNAVTLLDHAGDHAAAAAALSRLGYGDAPARPATRNGTHAAPHAEPARPAPPRRERPAREPFPTRHLPPVVRELAEAAGRALDEEPSAVAVHALAATAAAVGNSRALQVKRSWSEPCCFWTLTVAGSGSRKSPAWAVATAPLVAMQMDAHEAHEAAVEEWRREREEWKARDKDSRGEEPKAPKPPPVRVTNDATIEAVGEILRGNPRGVLVSRDELDGWFGSMTRYKGKGGGTDRPHWLELSRAGALSIDRLTRERGPLRVRRALASVTGTIQPGVLARGFDREAMDAGLAARFLMTMPPRRLHRWTEDDVPEPVETAYRDLLVRLDGLPLDGRSPYFLGLSREARALWVEFYDDWSAVQYHADGAEAACYSKIEGYALRLMLWHRVVSEVAEGREPVCSVTPDSAEAGVALARWFAGEAVRVYALLSETDDERRTRELVEQVERRGGSVTARELHKNARTRYPSPDAAANALDALASAGYGGWRERTPPGGGRPTREFALHGAGAEGRYPETPSGAEEHAVF